MQQYTEHDKTLENALDGKNTPFQFVRFQTRKARVFKLLAVAGILCIIAWAGIDILYKNFRPVANNDFSGEVKIEQGRLIIKDALYRSQEEGRLFAINAEKASHSFDNENYAILTKPSAEFENQDGSWSYVRAQHGIIDRNSKHFKVER